MPIMPEYWSRTIPNLNRGPEVRKRAANISRKIASFGGVKGALYAYQNAAKWKRVGVSKHLKLVRYDGHILEQEY
jgi:hypothetical protein